MATRSAEGLQTLLDKEGVNGAVLSETIVDALNSPMDLYRGYLAHTLQSITQCEPHVVYDSIQWPGDQADLMVVLPRLKLPDTDWNELAGKIIQQFPASPLFGLPFADGVHLRLLFSPITLARILLPYITDRGASYGKFRPTGPQITNGSSTNGQCQRVIVEFSSPNIGKEFDGTHLRSTAIGAFIAALYQSSGFRVHRLNFFGDWGKHIGLLAVGWTRFGSDELFAADPLKHLLDVYTKIDEASKAEQHDPDIKAIRGYENRNENLSVAAEKDEFFKRMEEGDPVALALCKSFRDVSVERYTKLYTRLGITFDETSGESLVTQETIEQVEESLTQKGLLEQTDDAWVVDFAKHGLKKIGTGVFRRNGTTSYLLRDVAAAIERDRSHFFDKMIYVVSARQDVHFQQLSRTLELMGHSELAGKLQHVSFGKIKDVPVGDGRSGLLLEDILDQSRDSVKMSLKANDDNILQDLGDSEKLAKALDRLAAAALMTQDLSVKRGVTLNFKLENLASPDQYTALTIHRCVQKLRTKLASGTVADETNFDHVDLSIFGAGDEYADVLRLLAQFPGIMKSAFKSLESSIVMAYLFRVTDQMDLVWETEDGEHRKSSEAVVPLLFYKCVQLVLENGLRALGLDFSLLDNLSDERHPRFGTVLGGTDHVGTPDLPEEMASHDEVRRHCGIGKDEAHDKDEDTKSELVNPADMRSEEMMLGEMTLEKPNPIEPDDENMVLEATQA